MIGAYLSIVAFTAAITKKGSVHESWYRIQPIVVRFHIIVLIHEHRIHQSNQFLSFRKCIPFKNHTAFRGIHDDNSKSLRTQVLLEFYNVVQATRSFRDARFSMRFLGFFDLLGILPRSFLMFSKVFCSPACRLLFSRNTTMALAQQSSSLFLISHTHRDCLAMCCQIFCPGPPPAR